MRGPEIGGGVQADRLREDLLVVNMGPQHPSTHGVLRLLLTLDGETVVDLVPIIGYLHTGIEKNTEYRTWQQGVTFVTRMDYLSPFFNETAYCLSVERLLGIQAPERAQVIRVLLMELTRIQSHLVWLATTGLELGAISMMLYGFREREAILDIFEAVTGLRMNYAFVRVGGLAMDLPEGVEDRIRGFVRTMRARVDEYETLLSDNPIWLERNRGVGILDAETCARLGVTGPLARAAGVARDLRIGHPLWEPYDFDVVVRDEADCFARYMVRIEEIRQSLRIVEQSLESLPDGPVMIEDPKLAWPGELTVGPDGIGNSERYVRHIMEESMEALINHFKIVTQGISVPAGEVYTAIESPRGELGYYVVSEGGVRPYRVRVRDPSFCNLIALPEMTKGGLVADVIACVASVDPVMGGVDR
ncbi:MAG TPA: NADH dehydrogenase (quinone) subunit D [Actinomycetota bacterium]|nr:NADH dehydrogenase (quinone) subunit D [Actinomycetota bacterium]